MITVHSGYCCIAISRKGSNIIDISMVDSTIYNNYLGFILYIASENAFDNTQLFLISSCIASN